MWPSEIKPIKLPHWANKTHIFSLALTQNLPTRWCCRLLLAQDKAWGTEGFRWQRDKTASWFLLSEGFLGFQLQRPSRVDGGWRKCWGGQRAAEAVKLQGRQRRRTPGGDVFIYFFQGLQTFRVHYTFFPESKINILHLKRKTNIKTQSGWVVIRWCKKNKHNNNL